MTTDCASNNIDTQSGSKKLHRRLIPVLRILFALVALILVVRSIDFRDYLVRGKEKFPIVSQTPVQYVVQDRESIEQAVSRQDPDYKFRFGAISLVRNLHGAKALVGLGIFAVVPLILVYRWKLLLEVLGVHLKIWKIFQLTYAGNFMNFFLIGTTGGDLVKAYWVGRFSPRRAEGFVSVFVDRLIGMVMLIMTAAVFVLLMWRDKQVAHLGRAVGVLAVLSAIAVVFLFSRRLRSLIRFDRWKGKLPISHLIDRIDQSLLAYRHAGGILLRTAALTVMLQVIGSTASYFLGSALEIHASIWYYWLYVPLAFLIGSIPVSVFWGFGLLEFAYINFFNTSGFATVTQAAMLAMAVRLMQLFWSLPGSIVLATGIGTEDKPLASTVENSLEAKIDPEKV